MMFGDNLGIFRAVDIDKNTTADEFKTVLMGCLSQEEHDCFTIDKLHLAPYPIDDCGTQVAVFKFSPPIPSFLKKVAAGEKKHLRDRKGNLIEIDANFWGLTQLNHPKEDILLDYNFGDAKPGKSIVAISGLANHAYGAWSGVESNGTVQMWLQDFLPEEPDLGSRCRIMIYGYSTQADDLVTYVAGFLEELFKARRKPLNFTRENYPIESHGIVVDKNSAVLGLPDDLEEDYDVDGDHISLIQFTGQAGRTYTTIIGLLQRLLARLRNKVSARTSS
ncbi:hypothetical protein AOL_s00215g513 [Orbilia oligospora ATCC 24927]|uniref:Uncharacterized protein n=1 Tax=Arthrobotrys oligospora (strain ATCC 24927 / CBS 115.81 / DSM 1491) TaxID=756982 RepID=G1XT15_ARTOA|nr:hypothetical protein AOL_s00215g513 [Orbilia oligospora ATCC 24927]EGX43777.1 hypothetical protein AOL_s00215g513 [Orbilia oligospora ATCC 24927]